MIAALFDFDGTLVGTRVWRCLVRQLLRQRVNVLPTLAYLAAHYAPYPVARAGLMSAETFRRIWARDMAWLVAGLSTERAARVFEATVREDLLPATRTAVLERFRWHRAQGHHTLILSGAFEPLLAAYGSAIDSGNVAGTALQANGGRYTGRAVGPLCFGEGKVTRLDAYLKANSLDVDLGASYAYADSYSDLPILRAVGHPVAVQPEEALARHARECGWGLM